MSLMLTAGQIITGTRYTLHSSGAVLTDDTGTIAAVGEIDTVAAHASPDTQHLDYGEDSTLLPGLVNAHVHLVFGASSDPVAASRDLTDQQLLVGSGFAHRGARSGHGGRPRRGRGRSAHG